MAARASLRTGRSTWICRQCQIRGMVTNYSARAKKRKLEAQGREWRYGTKLKAADAEWAAQAQRIRAGEQQSLYQKLKERGFIHQVAGDEAEIERIMIDKRIGIYAGIDPTGPSMHVGHLLPFMVLLWFYIHGYRAISLLGGATSRIGDPTGRTTSRHSQQSSIRKANMASMHIQITNIWENMERYAMQYGYRSQAVWKRGLVNNNKWWNKLPVMEFMHYVGQSARVGTLLSRDTAKRKLEGESGLSYAELGYPMMQGWDWWELYKQQDIQVQIGGSDQFGNIISGLEIVNRIVPEVIDRSIEPEKFDKNATRFGLTVPLLTTAKGEKIGKSAGNAIYLDKQMTSPFELYQYFLGLPDEDAIRLLKLFTLMPLADIETLSDKHRQAPHKRAAHHRLALDVLTLVHGGPIATLTANQHNAMFGQTFRLPSAPHEYIGTQNPNDLNVKTNPNAVPVNASSAWDYRIFLPRSLVENTPPARILYHSGLVNTRSEGQRLIDARGAYYGGETGVERLSPESAPEMPDELKFVKISNTDGSSSRKMMIGNDTMILRTGKTKIKIIRVLEDDEFDANGYTAPGWNEFKANAKAANSTSKEHPPQQSTASTSA